MSCLVYSINLYILKVGRQADGALVTTFNQLQTATTLPFCQYIVYISRNRGFSPLLRFFMFHFQLIKLIIMANSVRMKIYSS